jgi:argininosuccinate lyase
MSKKQNILTDLEDGKIVNMLNDLKRYGTSCRTRISEFRADGHEIESKVIDKSGALAYYMPE